MKILYALVLSSCLVSPYAYAEKQTEVWYNAKGEAALVTWEETSNKSPEMIPSYVAHWNGKSYANRTYRNNQSYSANYHRCGHPVYFGHRHSNVVLHPYSYGRCQPYGNVTYRSNYQSQFQARYQRSNGKTSWGVTFSRPNFSVNFYR